ncbi:hypothetical protein NNA36_05350 [Shimia sp. CNT1-13L.2]|uniref:DUF2946 family protein n=1 Tax=Shimia sp. CNT1-13L.2 TaxID=2959663 RepID=UPI0020CBC787|nr:DUF2946 family protein [Shimia sp. CNT1-13L.2]MCP9481380.1 hypothetical protein [Shimia sp. CNT1-13L.2]
MLAQNFYRARSRRGAEARLRRLFVPVLGMLALILQMILPAVSQASEGEWIEICAEYGPVMMQIDFEDEEGEAPCPDCGDCVMCAVSVPGLSDADPMIVSVAASLSEEAPLVGGIAPEGVRWLRPITRGPPAAPQVRTDRAPCAFMAYSLSEGGAL